MHKKFTNDLISETSPYLLQHAHNPVSWVSWSKEAFERAKKEDKLVLVSIGYSACHWCHVMEHESFEDEEVATWMNRYFVCIKVDREERPDVDQVYMTAVQLMTQKGGWPLNCFTLPDGKPVYGGTYFQKEHWIHILKSLEHTYRNKKEEVLAYAENLQKGVQQSEWIQSPAQIKHFTSEKLDEMVLKWSKSFDTREGGSNRAPKFPLPNNYEFLLRYSYQTNENNIGLKAKTFKQTLLSLDKIAFGGIYDHVGGGFCRYSVDVLWKVPHFEKMLYDNAQLVSLYSKAYQLTKNSTYKESVIQTLKWVEREMTTKYGSFYSALDADSEGEEGKFYVWKEEELKNILGKDYNWVKEFYNVNQIGYWEHNNYILLKKEHDNDFCKRLNLNLTEFQEKVQHINELLLSYRNQRVKPGLDYKCLTSWNAMQLKAYTDAYKAFEDESYLLAALKNAKWIQKYQLKADGTLFRNFVNGKSSIDGFLEDYAQTIQAFIALYEVTFDEQHLLFAKKLCSKCIELFQDEKSKMFYFTDFNSELIARKMEINDNVIPASNSVMCLNLYFLGKYFEDQKLLDNSQQMLKNVYDGMEQYGSGYSNWGICLMHHLNGIKEVCIVGNDFDKCRRLIQKEYLPNCLFLGGNKSNLPLLKEKDLLKNKFYVCENKSCSLPYEDLGEFLEKIRD
jgi:uncharacterized protein